MPAPRCLWCTDPPLDEITVLRWRGANPEIAEDKERMTVALCRKHLERLRKAGQRGRENKGWMYKEGWW